MLSRRDFIRNTVRLAVAGAVIPGVLTQLLPSVAPAALAGGGPGPIIRRDKRTNEKTPVSVEMLSETEPFVGEYAFLPAVVYKVRVDKLIGSAAKRGYNTAQHAIAFPDEDKFAIVAYEGKCKHLGCTIGWNGGLGGSKDVEDYDGDGANDGRVLCPCHQGQYDIFDLALNQPGTPPPSPLNVIRLNIADYPGDEVKRIPSGRNVLMGVETIVQTKYRAADKAGDGTAYKLRPAGVEVAPKAYGWEGGTA